MYAEKGVKYLKIFFSFLQLTANQNLMFIEPYCKIAAKTKE